LRDHHIVLRPQGDCPKIRKVLFALVKEGRKSFGYATEGISFVVAMKVIVDGVPKIINLTKIPQKHFY
jgi:hypothetical protein